VTSQHPADFDHHSGWDDELAPSLDKKSGAGFVVIVINVGGGDEHTGIDNDHAPNSALRISSTRTDRS